MDFGEIPPWAAIPALIALGLLFVFAFRKSHPRIEARRLGDAENGVRFELAVDNVTEVPVHIGGFVPVKPWRTKLALAGKEDAEPLAAIHCDEWLEPGARWSTEFTVLAMPGGDVRHVLMACQIRTKRFMNNSRTRWVRLPMMPEQNAKP